MRETTVVLEHEDSLFAQWKIATADDYRIDRIRISFDLHRVMSTTFLPCDDVVLQKFKNYYDASALRDIPHNQPCGVLFGVTVFRDETLQGRKLILESEHHTL